VKITRVITNILKRRAPPAPMRVQPREIIYTIWQEDLPDELKHRPNGTVAGGDWDAGKELFESSVVYRSFFEHFSQHVPWRDTEYHDLLEQGHLSRRVNANGGVNGLLDSYSRLFELMQATGFSTLKPIKIHIGRNGEFIRWDGSHRLAIAKILELPEIPVKVNLIHQAARDQAVRLGMLRS
jgi:hypothetical protein